MTATFERGSTRDPLDVVLSAELNDDSTQEISVCLLTSFLLFVEWLVYHDSSCCSQTEQTLSTVAWRVQRHGRYATQAITTVLVLVALLSNLLYLYLVTWLVSTSHTTLRGVSSVNELRVWVPYEDALGYTVFGVLQKELLTVSM